MIDSSATEEEILIEMKETDWSSVTNRPCRVTPPAWVRKMLVDGS